MKKILIIFFTICSFCFASNLRLTKGDGYVFAKTKEQLEKVISLSVSKDHQALEKYVEKLERLEEGGILKENAKVYVEESTWGGLVKIRPKGETETWWTIIEALKK